MQQANQVWMLSSDTGPEGIEGSLALEEDRLVFRPKGDTQTTTIRLADVRRVRRVIGSPILDIRLRSATGPSRYGFYFVQPPSLQPQEGLRPTRPRTARRKAAVQLMVSNPLKKDEIKRWVKAMRTAMAETKDEPGGG